MRVVWIVVCLVGLSVPPVDGVSGQVGGDTEAAMNLFFDCQGFGCWDLDFFRREIPFVNWVRDREDSDVHVLVTTQTTGGGGRQYGLSFLGRRDFEGQDQMVLVNTSGDATDDDVRRALVARLRLGLGRYLASTSRADEFSVLGREGRPGAPSPQAAGPVDDPWDSWVFTVRGSASLNGESSVSSSRYNTSLSANRTTEEWKLNLSGRFSRSATTFELTEESFETVREDWSATGLLVKSVGDHVSIGSSGEMGRSSRLNEDFRWRVSPGVELNVFPYSESSRRSLTLQALVNARHWDYELETIFGETEETRLSGTLQTSLELIQPWGRTSLSLGHSRYFHDTSKYQVSLGGFLEVRLFKGFSVNMSGSYGWIRDQLHIPAEGSTDEEILTRQRQLETDFQYFTSFGISYRFGSIFNNVVNPRFGHGGGPRIMFF